MAPSKRVRFEVLRRDALRCHYCGHGAPDVALTVDHVIPVALGGTDDPANLVTACAECNAGKSSTSPDEHVVAQVSEDALRWAAAMKEAHQCMRLERDVLAAKTSQFYAAWTAWNKSGNYLPDDWEVSIQRWLDAGLTIEDILEAHTIACLSSCSVSKTFRYMAGIVNNWLREARARASEALREGH